MTLIRIIFLLISVSFSDILFAQHTISGKIIDDETGKIIAGANVYINNTTIGSPSDKDGLFYITNIPIGQQELVISFVGYEVMSYAFSSNQLPLKIDFKLKPHTKALNEVVIKGGFKIVTDNPNYWNTFLRTFIGNTPFSNQCIIKNKEDIELRLFEKNGTVPVLNAIAKKPIIVINKALGYIIEYDLQFYEAKGFSRRYFGKAYFRELTEKEVSKAKLKLREAAYYGSITHFLKSLYHNTTEKDGFEIRTISRNVSPGKKKYLSLLADKNSDKDKLRNFIINKNDNLFGDSSAIIRASILQPDTDIVSKNLVNTKDIKAVNKTGNAVLISQDSLFSVVYKKSLANVIDRFNKSSKSKDGFAKSVFKLKPNQEYIINPKINSVNTGIGFEGFFSDFYSISTMLPEDFEPIKPNN